ncbi:MAG: phosphomannomutase/phosphoglucomutase [Candidatus Pacebacteria bacterium]|jgi:phosphomannomutase|nr:phosphomannomutase/phosphoglucomutase [Candidatus Paceibacterota bacterium]
MSDIFKAYDIRGIYPEQINEESAFKMGQAFVVFLKQKTNRDKLKIVLARDNRLSSQSLFDELKRGVLSQGGDVVDIGLATTPLFYFSVAHYGYDGGIIVTASHNPPQYNGFKVVSSEARPVGEETGLMEIREIFLKNDFKEGALGNVEEKKTIDDYVAVNGSSEDFKDIRIVVDTANSVSGILVPEMLKNVNLIHIFSELDGRFPNHEPNPFKKENVVSLKEMIVKEKADLGAGFDGDGDRIIFLDEKGETVPSDLILALMASLILKDNSKAKIVHDIRSGDVVKETVEGLGGIAIPCRVGHSFFRQKMREEDAAFGGEYTGHFFSGRPYFIESPFFVLFSVLGILKQEKKTLSQIISPFRKYFHSGEINFEVKDKEGKIKELKSRYQEGRATEIDGLRVDFDDWWFLVRASNTEPLIRLIIEAKTQDILKNKVGELTSFLE